MGVVSLPLQLCEREGRGGLLRPCRLGGREGLGVEIRVETIETSAFDSTPDLLLKHLSDDSLHVELAGCGNSSLPASDAFVKTASGAVLRLSSVRLLLVGVLGPFASTG